MTHSGAGIAPGEAHVGCKDMKSHGKEILVALALGLLSASCSSIHATKQTREHNIQNVTVIGLSPQPLILAWHPEMTLGSIIESREVTELLSHYEESTRPNINVTIEHPSNAGIIPHPELISRVLPGDRITFEAEKK